MSVNRSGDYKVSEFLFKKYIAATKCLAASSNVQMLRCFDKPDRSRKPCRGDMMETLVRKAQSGDAEAFICLMEECKMTLRRVAYGYLGNDEDVADAIQDTILAAYENLHTLQKREHFKTWLVRILINNCTKTWRQKKRSASWEGGCYADYVQETDQGSADVKFRQLLMSLPEDSRIIFQLYYGEQFTTKEIASVLNMKESTVKSRLHRGREQLRTELS